MTPLSKGKRVTKEVRNCPSHLKGFEASEL